MRIGIDARLIEETGVGRYIRNLIEQLGAQDQEHTFVVFLRQKSFDTFVVPNTRWRKQLADVAWHTFREQLVMPKILGDAKLDLVHIPYHNPPIFYRGRMVITIHDLTILHFATGKATTLPLFIYALKRLGYWIELAVGLRLAKAVIAVSETTKQEIVDHFGIAAEKISVVYEGVDSHLLKKSSKRIIDYPYFLYVGNAYPHKNLETLLTVFEHLNETLVLVGRPDYFYKRLKERTKNKNILFFGQANDEQLHSLYIHARALVFPSLMEGFGLPALEALALDCPVIVSDIPIFHEILGNNATYFDPNDAKSIRDALLQAHKSSAAIRNKILAAYSWKLMAAQTLAMYKRVMLS